MMLFVAPVTFPKSVLVGLSSGLLHSTASKRFCTDREVPDDVRIHQEQPRTTHAVHTERELTLLERRRLRIGRRHETCCVEPGLRLIERAVTQQRDLRL